MVRQRQPCCVVAAALAWACLAGNAASVSAQDGTIRESTDPVKAAEPVGVARETTSGGVALLLGGITVENRVAMQAERPRFNLWVATVAKPSGAFLSDDSTSQVNPDMERPLGSNPFGDPARP